MNFNQPKEAKKKNSTHKHDEGTDESEYEKRRAEEKKAIVGVNFKQPNEVERTATQRKTER